jgi:hypothetical protein
VWDAFSDVGLLFDGNAHDGFKPVHVSSGDSYSMITTDGKLEITWGEDKRFEKVAALQGMKTTDDADWHKEKPVIDFSDRATLPGIIANARAALPAMWDIIAATPWDEYIQNHNVDSRGMNEVNAIAHLRAAKAVVVNENSRYEKDDVGRRRRFTRAVSLASGLSRDLHEKYPEIYPEPPPVMAYDPARANDQLVALSPEQLQQPEKFFTARHPAGRSL